MFLKKSIFLFFLLINFSLFSQKKYQKKYYKNNVLKEEGWINKNQKNGYCLFYIDKKIVKASKFKNEKKLKEWTNLSSFRKENNLNDLR